MVLQERLPLAQLIGLDDDLPGDLGQPRVQARDLLVEVLETGGDVGDLPLHLDEQGRDPIVLGAHRGQLCVGSVELGGKGG